MVVRTFLCISLTATLLAGSSVAFAQNHVSQADIDKSVGRLAGKTVKKLAGPVTLLILVGDANAAYETHCTHLKEEEAVRNCTIQHALKTQVEDISEIADQAEIAWKYVVVPKAEGFWSEHGDDIKDTARKVANAIARGILRLNDWLEKD